MQDALKHEVPALSVLDRGSRMTQLAPGQPVGQLDGALIGRVLVCVVLWTVASSTPYMGLLGIVPTVPALQWLASPWGLGVAVVLAAFAFVQTSALRAHTRYVFGQQRVASLLGSLTVTAGFAAGAAVWTLVSVRVESAPLWDLTHIVTASDLPSELAVLVGGIFAAWTLFTLIQLPGTVRHARARQAALARLRETGRRHAGVLTDVTFRNYWVWDDPFFTIRVTYDLDGAPRDVAGHMRTRADRVPVVGSRMIVLSDGQGTVNLELDPDAHTEFEDEARYRAPEG